MEDVVMSSDNGQEGQSQNIRRGQGKSKHRSDPNGKRASRQTSKAVKPQSVRASGTASTRSDQSQPRPTTTGGILNQLILQAENRLVRIDAQFKQLEQEKQETVAELEKLRTLLAELQKRVDENQ
jgi:hypothetical protein